jgi:hypothetical protein
MLGWPSGTVIRRRAGVRGARLAEHLAGKHDQRRHAHKRGAAAVYAGDFNTLRATFPNLRSVNLDGKTPYASSVVDTLDRLGREYPALAERLTKIGVRHVEEAMGPVTLAATHPVTGEMALNPKFWSTEGPLIEQQRRYRTGEHRYTAESPTPEYVVAHEFAHLAIRNEWEHVTVSRQVTDAMRGKRPPSSVAYQSESEAWAEAFAEVWVGGDEAATYRPLVNAVTSGLPEPGFVILGASEAFAEHLVGQHDQRKHGHKGGMAAVHEAKAKEVFGVTDDMHEAGYVTPDGTMLDFSGRHEATGYHKEGDRFVPDKGPPSSRWPQQGTADYLAGQRNVDHREVSDVVPEQVGEWSGYGYGEGRMRTLQSEGFARVTAQGDDLGIEIMGKLTQAQFSTFARALPEYQSVTLDRVDADGRSKEYVTNWQDPGLSSASILRRFTEALVEHLAGKHDQRRHAHKRGGGLTVTVPAGALAPGTELVYGGGIPWDFDSKYPGVTLRGDRVISPNDPRIPDTVYHVTTNAPAIRDSGFIDARGEGGLGGDRSDQIVSMTIDRGIARQLAADMRFHGEVAGLSPRAALDRLQSQADAEGWGGTFRAEIERGGDVYLKGYDTHGFEGLYYSMRSRETGAKNPLFLGDSRPDPAKVGVIAIPARNLDNGALLVDFDLSNPVGLQEIRSYGDVSIEDGEFFAEALVEHLTGKHNQKAHGRRLSNAAILSILKETHPNLRSVDLQQMAPSLRSAVTLRLESLGKTWPAGARGLTGLRAAYRDGPDGEICSVDPDTGMLYFDTAEWGSTTLMRQMLNRTGQTGTFGPTGETIHEYPVKTVTPDYFVTHEYGHVVHRAANAAGTGEMGRDGPWTQTVMRSYMAEAMRDALPLSIYSMGNPIEWWGEVFGAANTKKSNLVRPLDPVEQGTFDLYMRAYADLTEAEHDPRPARLYELQASGQVERHRLPEGAALRGVPRGHPRRDPAGQDRASPAVRGRSRDRLRAGPGAATRLRRVAEHLTGKHDQRRHAAKRGARLAMPGEPGLRADYLALGQTAELAALKGTFPNLRTVFLDGVEPGNRAVIVGELNRLGQKYPVSAKQLESVGTFTYAGTAETDVLNGTMHFSSLAFGDRGSTAAALNRANASGLFATDNVTVPYIVTHEYGHIVERATGWDAGEAANYMGNARPISTYGADIGAHPQAGGTRENFAEMFAAYDLGTRPLDRSQRSLLTTVLDAAGEAPPTFAPAPGQATLFEHLAGKHNQKAHGRKGGFDPSRPIPDGLGPYTAAQQQGAVRAWQSSFEMCQDMKAGMLGNKVNAPMAEAFREAAMASPLVHGAVYKGINAKPEQFKVGARVEIKTFESASPDLDTAVRFGDTLFEITGGSAHDIRAMSRFPDFAEVVLEPGRFGVVGVREGPMSATSIFGPVSPRPTTIVSLVAVPEGLP